MKVSLYNPIEPRT